MRQMTFLPALTMRSSLTSLAAPFTQTLCMHKQKTYALHFVAHADSMPREEFLKAVNCDTSLPNRIGCTGFGRKSSRNQYLPFAGSILETAAKTSLEAENSSISATMKAIIDLFRRLVYRSWVSSVKQNRRSRSCWDGIHSRASNIRARSSFFHSTMATLLDYASDNIPTETSTSAFAVLKLKYSSKSEWDFSLP